MANNPQMKNKSTLNHNQLKYTLLGTVICLLLAYWSYSAINYAIMVQEAKTLVLDGLFYPEAAQFYDNKTTLDGSTLTMFVKAQTGFGGEGIAIFYVNTQTKEVSCEKTLLPLEEHKPQGLISNF
jgi:hypothetical protein